MKSFYDLLLTDRKFALYFAIYIGFNVWVYLRGWKTAAIGIALFMALIIGFNLWKTSK